jgi:hypothetical protein
MQARDVAALTWLAEQYGAPIDVVAKLLAKPGQDAERAYAMTWPVVQRWAMAEWVCLVRGFGPFLWVVPTPVWAGRLLGWTPKTAWFPSASRVEHVAACALTRLA